MMFLQYANSRKSVILSAEPLPCLSRLCPKLGGSTAAPSPPCAYIELQWWKWEENSDFKAFFEKKIQFSQHPPLPIELIFCTEKIINKTAYMATQVACGWAGEVLEKVTRASGQEPHAQKAPKRRKSNRSTKGNMWSAIPVALLCMVVNWNERTKSCRTQRTFVRLSIRLFVCLSPPGPLRPEICPLRPWIWEGWFKTWKDWFQVW